MDLFTIDVTENELLFIRQALDLINIAGKDAKFLANLQVKIEGELQQIQELKTSEKVKVKKALQEAVEADAVRNKK